MYAYAAMQMQMQVIRGTWNDNVQCTMYNARSTLDMHSFTSHMSTFFSHVSGLRGANGTCAVSRDVSFNMYWLYRYMISFCRDLPYCTTCMKRAHRVRTYR